MTKHPLLALTTTGALIAALAGCAPIEADTRIAVTQDASTCELSQTTAPAGVTTFAITNAGDTTAEFYILRTSDGGIVSEVENITAGLSRELTVELAEGAYTYSCEQMNGGDPLRGELTVTASNATADSNPAVDQAITEYTAFALSEAKILQQKTSEFAAAVTAGDEEQARRLYAPTRVHWERIEPVAESFGDIDPRIDAREGDLPEGTPWTGWHALEKQLWVTGLDGTSTALAEQLVADTADLVERMGNVELTITQMGNGAKELLDEVATGKVTGEEERYSHTDLWDFEANIFGAMTVVDVSRDVLALSSPELLAELDDVFAELNAELDLHRSGNGFVLYTELTSDEVAELAALVEKVSEPLAGLAAALIK